jgi:hypothetical protein
MAMTKSKQESWQVGKLVVGKLAVDKLASWLALPTNAGKVK